MHGKSQCDFFANQTKQNAKAAFPILDRIAVNKKRTACTTCFCIQNNNWSQSGQHTALPLVHWNEPMFEHIALLFTTSATGAIGSARVYNYPTTCCQW